MRRRNVILLLWLFVAAPACILSGQTAEQNNNCYSIVVGKNVSADGWVMMAHNEDDYIPQVVNHHKVPRKSHNPKATVQLVNGGTVEQVPETWSYIWSEIPGLLFSDSYLNEWGVCVCSDACPSREDHPELTDGGITYMLRRLVAERAKSAREGVNIAGELVERFGYASSGRTYIISDPNEGWLFCAVNGRHWVAQRVPDDQVALIANTYTVNEIDLRDTVNFLGSADIIDYAKERYWYDPAVDGAFNFAKAYADSATAADPRNIGRQWDGIRLVAADPPDYGQPLPFAVKPRHKLDVTAITKVLRSHYEDTDLAEADKAAGCPHTNPTMPICRDDTQTSFVVQLRGDMPPEIGLLYWVALSSPCISCYVPYHFGIAEFPASYLASAKQPTKEQYELAVDRPFEIDSSSAFWTFTHFRYRMEHQYSDLIELLRDRLDLVEAGAFRKQAAMERSALKLFEESPDRSIQILDDYSRDVLRGAISEIAQVQFVD